LRDWSDSEQVPLIIVRMNQKQIVCFLIRLVLINFLEKLCEDGQSQD